MLPLGPEKGLDFGASAPAQPTGRDAAAEGTPEQRALWAWMATDEGPTQRVYRSQVDLAVVAFLSGFAAGAAAQAERLKAAEHALIRVEVEAKLAGTQRAHALRKITLYAQAGLLEMWRTDRPAPCRLCAEAGPHAHAVGESA